MGLKGPDQQGHGLVRESRKDSSTVVKKLLVVVVLALSAFAVWRKVQADRAELDLWTAATTDDDQ
jgi:hypothetical protein